MRTTLPNHRSHRSPTDDEPPTELLTPLGHGSATAPRPMVAGARRLLSRLLERMHTGCLEVTAPDGTTTVYGPGGSVGTGGESLTASLRVLDERAWWAVLSEGSIGFGRGYIERWWHSDDPTTVVRLLIANMDRIDDLRCGLARATSPLLDPVRRRLPARNRSRNREDISAHYDIGNEFFAQFLDGTMSYSSAVFASPADTLRQASLSKYDRLLDKLDVGSTDRVLEIGTGWGGFAIRAAGTRACDVTTTTISTEQRAEAVERLVTAGLDDRVTVLDSDWRDLTGTFDKVVSIEMIEAVDWRDYGRFFSTIERCLKPDGMVGLQAICVPDRRYAAARNTEDFIRRFVFPGGGLPSIGTLADAVAGTRLQLLDVDDFSAHYAETLGRWRERFDANTDEIDDLGLDARFQRLWRFYLAYCEAAFLERHCTVNQFVLVGPDWRPDSLALRPH